ncbi:hypothetical protein RRG08_020455 [Elysia crispata]|uniref:Uncharacterized protein n=1 Tax=Elysia crispata TaxID=231223 RepID=A0AAE1B5Q5_9GAST|nr:hypothetical protein RRG08_020455 [Elysia crispata]
MASYSLLRLPPTLPTLHSNRFILTPPRPTPLIPAPPTSLLRPIPPDPPTPPSCLSPSPPQAGPMRQSFYLENSKRPDSDEVSSV